MILNDENANTINKVSKATNAGKKGKTIEETYTKKTQLEHILLRPDTYIGSIERQTQPMWVLDSETKRVVMKNISFVPGLFKIFDEIVVNAADNKQRDPSMNRIEVTINPEENCIRVWNNGSGIPVAIHQEHGIYVPELIFGNLLTGSNFDDEEQKTTGGRNGYGAKLANIFSTRFIVETADKSRGLKYRQEFTNNMGNKGEPVVTKHSGPEFTCITFYPDLRRFKMDLLDEDIVSLFSKRVYDIAGTNSSKGTKLTVKLNGEKLEVRNFESYLSLYDGLEEPVTFAKVNENWEVGIGVSDGAFQQVSFVNSICTSKGGCHVNYLVDQVTAKMAAVIKKKNKGEEVKAHQIKNHLAIFVNCLIVNPAFDSQTKENLTTKATAFGTTCTLPDKMLKALEKSAIVDNILNWAKFKQTAELKKKSGSKRSKLFGITKLDDANYAGTAKSSQCTLILTEGDSAKALAISGLGVVGRDYYGVFPLRGKLLNVREASHAQIMKNEEIQNITKILGLTFGKVYEDISSLRYGHLMIMTDQDHDGSHIKGLLINFLHHFWPSLLQIDGFLQQFITPILKCSKGKQELSFYTVPEYEQWKESQGDAQGWRIKYYKGLGTSTAQEAKEYFSNLDTHQIDFSWDENANDVIEMAFAKKRVEDRKLWLLAMEPGIHIDYKVSRICYNDFVNHELILFSHADNERSIAHFMDGMKPSQRKVLFACFKRNLKQEIKVAQLAGYISEHSAYHHGEASLTQTIIGMAQNFIGSNNVNLLSPCGQFGTRLMGGKDAASPRYVFTKLETITRYLFHPDDDALLEYLDEDGQSIEPTYYVPIIPMVLVNGSEGIGTGWSSSIPTYNPREIIANLRLMIEGEAPQDMVPWFRGFTGSVQSKAGKDGGSFIVSGIMEQPDDQTVVISELPVGRWTTDYKQFLEGVLIGGAGAGSKEKDKEKEDGGAVAAPTGGPFVKDFKENHTDTTVLFTVTCPAEKLAGQDDAALVKKFKLETSISTSNMHLFDLNSQIRKFEGPLQVLQEFFKVRLLYYDRRKAHLVKTMTEDWEKLDNKMRFVLAVTKGEIVVANRKKAELLQELRAKGFKTFTDRKKVYSEVDNENNENENVEIDPFEKGYDYLLSMKIWSLTMEKVHDLIAERNNMRSKLDELMTKTAEMLWLEDLSQLEMALDEFEAALDEDKQQELKARKKAATKAGKTTTNKTSKSPSSRKVATPATNHVSSSSSSSSSSSKLTSSAPSSSGGAHDGVSGLGDVTQSTAGQHVITGKVTMPSSLSDLTKPQAKTSTTTTNKRSRSTTSSTASKPITAFLKPAVTAVDNPLTSQSSIEPMAIDLSEDLVNTPIAVTPVQEVIAVVGSGSTRPKRQTSSRKRFLESSDEEDDYFVDSDQSDDEDTVLDADDSDYNSDPKPKKRSKRSIKTASLSPNTQSTPKQSLSPAVDTPVQAKKASRSSSSTTGPSRAKKARTVLSSPSPTPVIIDITNTPATPIPVPPAITAANAANPSVKSTNRGSTAKSAAKAKTTPKSSSKAKSSGKKKVAAAAASLSSNEEEMDVDDKPIGSFTSRPSRQRKVTDYSKFYGEQEASSSSEEDESNDYSESD